MTARIRVAILLGALVALVAVPALAGSAEQGRDLLKSKGCLACHSLDGAASVGPTLDGVVERTSPEYVRRAIAIVFIITILVFLLYFIYYFNFYCIHFFYCVLYVILEHHIIPNRVRFFTSCMVLIVVIIELVIFITISLQFFQHLE